MEQLTFSQSAKQEIIKTVKSQKACCQKSFLYGVLGANATYTLKEHGLCPVASSADLPLLELCADIAYKQFNLACELVKEQKNKRVKYVAVFPAELSEKLKLTEVATDGSLQINENEIRLENQCCALNFVKGLFACYGSVTIPKHTENLAQTTPSQSYHLEIILNNLSWQTEVLNMLNEICDGFKVILRKETAVFYLKDATTIGDFLVSLGAIRSKLSLENVLAERSMRNTANRQTNCISANIDKTLSASNKHIDAIRKLKKSGLFSALSDELKEIAELRERYPDVSLADLAEMAKLTKNCVGKRLNKIVALAQKVK